MLSQRTLFHLEGTGMFDNIRGLSAAHSPYYSEANDQAPAPSDESHQGGRSSYDRFGPLTARRDAVSEFGSVVSNELFGEYHAPHYQDPTVYSQWSTGRRPRSDSSAGSFASADDRSFHERSSADSDAWSHLPPSSTSSSNISSLHPLSDIGQTLSEAGGRSSPGGYPSSYPSDRNWNAHQNRLPSVSDGSAQRSLTGSELDAIHSARQDGRFLSGRSELGSVASGIDYNGGHFGRRGGTHQYGNGTGTVSSTAESLSDAGGGGISPERAEILERLKKAREGIFVPADLPSGAWQPDTTFTASDILPSTAPTEMGPPTRRPPPPPSRLRHGGYPQSNSSAATSSVQSSLPPRGRPAIYGQQTPMDRAWNALTRRR